MNDTLDPTFAAALFDCREVVQLQLQFDRGKLAEGVIEFGGAEPGFNSYRGDHYERELRRAVAEFEKEQEAKADAIIEKWAAETKREEVPALRYEKSRTGTSL